MEPDFKIFRHLMIAA